MVVDREALDAFLERKRRRGRWVLGVTVAAVALTLWLDYRLTIFAIVALPFPLLVSLQVRAFERELGATSFYELGLEEAAVTIGTSSEVLTIPFDEIVAVRVAPDHLVVVQRTRDPHRPRHFTLPGEQAELRALAKAFRRRGLAVVDEGLSSGL